MKKCILITALLLLSSNAGALRNGCVPGTSGCGDCSKNPNDVHCIPGGTNLLSGYADVNADGHTDILWWDEASFDVQVWKMLDVSQIRTLQNLFLTPRKVSGSNWRAVATGYFHDHDQAPQMDVVWQNDVTGEARIWLMNGTVRTLEVPLVCPGGITCTAPSRSWKIAAAGYYGAPPGRDQRDGMTDILWRNVDTGAMHFWLMDGTTVKSEVVLPQSPRVAGDPAWRVAGAGFFDPGYDLWSDILWYNPQTGRILVWRMNGTSLQTEILLTASQPDLAWKLVGSGVFHAAENTDQYPDLLWRNDQTGELRVWEFDGTVDRIRAIRVLATSPDGRSDLTWEPLAK